MEKVNLHGDTVASNGDSIDSTVVNNLQGKKGTTKIIIVLKINMFNSELCNSTSTLLPDFDLI